MNDILEFVENAVREGWRVSLYNDGDDGAVYWNNNKERPDYLLTTEELHQRLQLLES